MALTTVQYFLILLKSRSISFLPASSFHFKAAFLNAFFLERYLYRGEKCFISHHDLSMRGEKALMAQHVQAYLCPEEPKHELISPIQDWRSKVHRKILTDIIVRWRWTILLKLYRILQIQHK